MRFGQRRVGALLCAAVAGAYRFPLPDADRRAFRCGGDGADGQGDGPCDARSDDGQSGFAAGFAGALVLGHAMGLGLPLPDADRLAFRCGDDGADGACVP